MVYFTSHIVPHKKAKDVLSQHVQHLIACKETNNIAFNSPAQKMPGKNRFRRVCTPKEKTLDSRKIVFVGDTSPHQSGGTGDNIPHIRKDDDGLSHNVSKGERRRSMLYISLYQHHLYGVLTPSSWNFSTTVRDRCATLLRPI